MSAALLIARLVLAAVFAVAGVAKLADLQGSRRAVAAFGVPTGLAGVVGVALPLAELAVAVLLLPEATAWWGALGALLLLLLFCAAIGVSLARGRAPDCHCFGQLHSAPAGRSTLLRNGALAAVAAFVLVAGVDDAGPGALEWIGDLEGSELIALVAGVVGLLAVAACAALALRLLRAHGRLLLRIDALEQRLRMAGIDMPEADAYELEESPLAGEPAPAFALPALDGSTVSLDDLLAAGRPALLVFSDPGCGPCQELAPDVAEWQQTFADELEVVVVSGGSAEDVREKLGAGRPDRTLLERDRDVAVSVEYSVNGTPGAVLVGADGVVVAGPAGGRPGVEHLLEHGLALARGEGEPTAGGLEPGTGAPALVLPALEGGEVELAAPRPGRRRRPVLEPGLRLLPPAPPRAAGVGGGAAGRRARPDRRLVVVGRLADRRGLPLHGAARCRQHGHGGVRRRRHADGRPHRRRGPRRVPPRGRRRRRPRAARRRRRARRSRCTGAARRRRPRRSRRLPRAAGVRSRDSPVAALEPPAYRRPGLPRTRRTRP